MKKLLAWIKSLVPFWKAGKKPVTPPAAPPVGTPAPVVRYVGVPDRSADRGAEIWKPNWHGCQIRLSANDTENIRGIAGSWYPLDAGVVGDNVQVTEDAAGNALVVGRDFTSMRTGYRYRWLGLVTETSGNPLVPGVSGVSITVPKARLTGALRIHWATVEG